MGFINMVTRLCLTTPQNGPVNMNLSVSGHEYTTHIAHAHAGVSNHGHSSKEQMVFSFHCLLFFG